MREIQVRDNDGNRHGRVIVDDSDNGEYMPKVLCGHDWGGNFRFWILREYDGEECYMVARGSFVVDSNGKWICS